MKYLLILFFSLTGFNTANAILIANTVPPDDEPLVYRHTLERAVLLDKLPIKLSPVEEMILRKRIVFKAISNIATRSIELDEELAKQLESLKPIVDYPTEEEFVKFKLREKAQKTKDSLETDTFIGIAEGETAITLKHQRVIAEEIELVTKEISGNIEELIKDIKKSTKPGKSGDNNYLNCESAFKKRVHDYSARKSQGNLI